MIQWYNTIINNFEICYALDIDYILYDQWYILLNGCDNYLSSQPCLENVSMCWTAYQMIMHVKDFQREHVPLNMSKFMSEYTQSSITFFCGMSWHEQLESWADSMTAGCCEDVLGTVRLSMFKSYWMSMQQLCFSFIELIWFVCHF